MLATLTLTHAGGGGARTRWHRRWAFGQLHFTAAPRTRYLLECDINAAPQITISATDDRGKYSVSGSESASLLYRRDNATNAAEPVVVLLSGDRTQWFLRGCELSWTPLGG